MIDGGVVDGGVCRNRAPGDDAAGRGDGQRLAGNERGRRAARRNADIAGQTLHAGDLRSVRSRDKKSDRAAYGDLRGRRDEAVVRFAAGRVMNVEFHGAVCERDRVQLAALGGIEFSNLNFGFLADVDGRRIGKLQRRERLHVGDREGVIRQHELSADLLGLSAQLVTHAALNAFESFVGCRSALERHERSHKPAKQKARR